MTLWDGVVWVSSYFLSHSVFLGHLGGLLVSGVYFSHQHLYFSGEARLGLFEKDVQWWKNSEKKSNNFCSAFHGSLVVTHKTSQELRMLSSVTINCQVQKVVMNSGSQLSEL